MSDFVWNEIEPAHDPTVDVVCGDHRLIQRESGRIEEIFVERITARRIQALRVVLPDRNDLKSYHLPQTFRGYFTRAYLRSHTTNLLGVVLWGVPNVG